LTNKPAFYKTDSIAEVKGSAFVFKENKGMAPSEVATIPTPANGLMIINTNSNETQMPDGTGFYVWGGSAWRKILLIENGNSTSGWPTRGNS